METEQIKRILESLIMASGSPLNIDRMLAAFEEKERPARAVIKEALEKLAEDYAKSSLELKEVSSGFRFQIRKDYSEWVSKLWEEKPARYSRALLETLSLIAYKQPITRGEIEMIRGVNVSTQIMKTLLEREWVTVVGHRDVPGKPAIYATTKQFLDYFNLKSLEELPALADIRDLDKINAELDLPDPNHDTDGMEPQQDALHESADVEDQGAGEAVVSIDLEEDEKTVDSGDMADAMTAEQ